MMMKKNRGGFDFFSDFANEGDDCPDNIIPSQNPALEIVTNTGLRSIEEMFRNNDQNGTFSDRQQQLRSFFCSLMTLCFFLLVDGLHDDLEPGGPSFEDLCRAHIQKFARGAENYAIETQLSYRVSKWQNRLKPILEDEENRPVFDIHQYGAHIIDMIEKTRERQVVRLHEANNSIDLKLVDFRDVSKNLPPHEVGRMFLASLSLCNSGNIIFEETHQRENPSSSLFVSLLQSDIVRPTTNYAALKETF